MFGLRPSRPTTPAPVLSPLRQQLQALVLDVASQGVSTLGLPIPTGALGRPLSAFLAARSDAELTDMLAVAQRVLDALWASVPADEQTAAVQRIQG